MSEPVLSANEWAAHHFRRPNESVVLHELDGSTFDATCYGQEAESSEGIVTISDTEWGPNALPSLIAVANDALPADDPRKITRAMVVALLEAHDEFEQTDDVTKRVVTIAAALASYLPPDQQPTDELADARASYEELKGP